MIRAGYRRDADNKWVGVLRANGRTLAECGHAHHNRDVSTHTHGEAATVCASMILAGALRPATAAARANRMRAAWTALTDNAGFQHPRTTIDAARTDSIHRAENYLTLVAQVRYAIADDPTLTGRPRRTPEPAPQQEIGDIPDWMI